MSETYAGSGTGDEGTPSGAGAGAGGDAASWRDSISEEFRNDPSLESIKDIDSLAKGYVSSQRMLGNRIPIPGEDAGDAAKQEFLQKLQQVPGVVKIPELDNEEELAQFQMKLGRPETIEGYQFRDPENIPENVEYNKEAEHWWKHKAFELGLSPEKAQKVLDEFNEFSFSGAKAQLEDKQKTIDELKREWGNKYERNEAVAKQAINKFAGEQAIKELIETNLGNNPGLMKMFAKIGESMLEDSVLKNPNLPSMRKTPVEIRHEINEIMANPAYMDAQHINHKILVDKVHQLNKELSESGHAQTF